MNSPYAPGYMWLRCLPHYSSSGGHLPMIVTALERQTMGQEPATTTTNDRRREEARRQKPVLLAHIQEYVLGRWQRETSGGEPVRDGSEGPRAG